MQRRSLFIASIITAAILVAGDLLTRRIASNSIPRQVIRAIASAPRIIDVLAVGNSLIAAGFNPVVVERRLVNSGRPPIAVNAGLGASGLIEHLILTRLAFRSHRVKTLIYGFFDLQLTSDLIQKNSDIIGNRNVLYYQEPEITLQYARFDLVERLTFQAYRRSALLRERSSIWEKVEKLRRAMISVGMPPEETNRFGRRNDFALLEAGDSQTFSLACRKVILSGNLLAAPFRALLQQAKQNGVNIVVVEMPMHPLHLDRYYSVSIWKTVRSQTQAAIEAAGAHYLDASAWVPDSHLFDDHLHLSKEGAKQFSQLLANYLIKLQS